MFMLRCIMSIIMESYIIMESSSSNETKNHKNHISNQGALTNFMAIQSKKNF